MKAKLNKSANYSVLILLCIFLFTSCGTDANDEDSTNNGTPPTDESIQYELTTSNTPEEAGSVEPSSGTYKDGSEIEISATANEGWRFDFAITSSELSCTL